MAETGVTAATESIEGPFLRVARRYSLCDDDAWEALARGFEIALRHRGRVRSDTAVAWFATVVCRNLGTQRSAGPLRPRLEAPWTPRARPQSARSARTGDPSYFPRKKVGGLRERFRPV